jgi:hypothetical protein
MPGPLDNIKRRRFLWGALLAWTPFVLFLLLVLRDAVRSISANKATGLGAVAGGLSELFWTFGLVGTVAVEVTAIAMLVRAFSADHPMRAVVSVLSICVSLLILVIFIGSAWMLFHLTH